jgi:hypothetical protein
MSHKEGKRKRRREREVAEQFLLAAGIALQARHRELARHVYEQNQDIGRPCHSCALNPQTNDWPGQAKTILRFLAALEKSEPFFCHDQAPQDDKGDWMVDPSSALWCSGLVALRGDAEAAVTVALRSAFAAIGRPAPEGPEADEIMHATLLQMISAAPTKMTRLLSGPPANDGESVRASSEMRVATR